MSYFSIWFYHQDVSILHIKGGMRSFSSARSILKYDYIILCMCTLCKKGCDEHLHLCHNYIVFHHTIYHTCAPRECRVWWSLSSWRRAAACARPAPLFFYRYVHKAYVYIHMHVCVCVCLCDLTIHMRGMTYCSTHVCMTHSAIYAPHP